MAKKRAHMDTLLLPQHNRYRVAIRRIRMLCMTPGIRPYARCHEGLILNLQGHTVDDKLVDIFNYYHADRHALSVSRAPEAGNCLAACLAVNSQR